MKVKSLDQLINYLHEDKSPDVKQFIINQIAKSVDSNKGYFWEDVLEKAMKSHTTRLHGNAVGRDFDDDTDAKFATFYRKSSGIYEASISGIKNKIGTLRVCLCVPGQGYHRVMFMRIPKSAYERYALGSNAIKFTMSPTGNIQGPLSKYRCSFDEVCGVEKDMISGYTEVS